MFYHIQGLCPRTDIDLGRCGFIIKLWPSWKEGVQRCGLDQDKIQNLIQSCHRSWLDGCGFNAMFDPDRDPMAEWEERHLGKKRKLGKNARHLYDQHSIRISWGEWGPEHLDVPGNACGLDIDDSIGSPRNGRTLVPHNIDSVNQVILLLTVFTSIADFIVSELEAKEWKQ